ncbi:MAG: glycerophosphodiester phosphodiesterase family protein [Longimicrobiales bacterium]
MMNRFPTGWRDALRAFPTFGRPLILFQLAFALVTGALLSPALAWLLDQLIRSSGDYAISNYDLVSFFLSFKGLAFLAGSAATALAILYLELTGLLMITADPDRPIRALPALRHGLLRFDKLLRLGLLQVAAGALAVAPFLLGIGVVKLTLLGAHDINYYLHLQPPEWTRALLISGALGLTGATVLGSLALRWLFALPILLSSGVRPWEALRESWILTRGRFLESIWTLGGWWLATSLLGAATAALLTRMAGVLLALVGLRPAIVFVVVAVFLTLLLTATLVVSFLTMGVTAILINRFFRDATGRRVEVPPGLHPAAPVPVLRNPIQVTWVAILAVFLGMTVVGVVWVSRLEFREGVAITAHRGSSRRAPENTLSSLRQAMEDGADFAEIDVQTTRDGHVVLLHDRDFMRLAGDPRRLEDLSLEEARALDVGSWFDPAFAGERVATITEAVDLVRGRLKLNIELKYNRPDPGLVPALIEVLREEGFIDQCVITSLDFASLEEVKRIEPRLETGLVLTQSVGNPARLPVDFLSVNTNAARNRLISHAHRTGKAIHVWTVNDRETMNRMIEAGVDNVITDEPYEMRRVLQEREELTRGEKLALQLRRLLLG